MCRPRNASAGQRDDLAGSEEFLGNPSRSRGAETPLLSLNHTQPNMGRTATRQKDGDADDDECVASRLVDASERLPTRARLLAKIVKSDEIPSDGGCEARGSIGESDMTGMEERWGRVGTVHRGAWVGSGTYEERPLTNAEQHPGLMYDAQLGTCVRPSEQRFGTGLRRPGCHTSRSFEILE